MPHACPTIFRVIRRLIGQLSTRRVGTLHAAKTETSLEPLTSPPLFERALR